MLVRLLLALLIALLPLPGAAAGAACHEGMKTTTEGYQGHHGQPSREQPAGSPEQSCIGCVAPSTLRAPSLATPPAYPRAIGTTVHSVGVARPAAPPATPPPRS